MREERERGSGREEGGREGGREGHNCEDVCVCVQTVTTGKSVSC